EAEGWRGALARLEPVRRIAGVRRYCGLLGWTGSGAHALLGVLPRRHGDLRLAALPATRGALVEGSDDLRQICPDHDGALGVPLVGQGTIRLIVRSDRIES